MDYRYGRQLLLGWYVGPLVRQRWLRSRGASPGRLRAAKGDELLPLDEKSPAGHRIGGEAQPVAGGRVCLLLLQLGLGGQRGGIQDRAPVPRAERRSRSMEVHKPLPSLPRADHGGFGGYRASPEKVQI